ncbi:Pro-resilin [Blattella germanica]|nr:Pro-resilin [Blattella germanica]
MMAALVSVLAEPQVGSTPGPMYLPLYRGTPASRSQYGIPEYNAVSEDYDDHDEPANYEFEYQVNDVDTGNDYGHKESRQGEVTQGTYRVLLPDGRTQIVDYVADKSGYRPQVRYEGEAAGYNYNQPSGVY